MTEIIVALVGFGTLITTFSLLLWKIGRSNEMERGKIYEKINVVENKVENEFVRNDLCDERHSAITRELKEIKEGIKEVKQDLKELMRRNGL